ncbi:MAG: glycosyltransferase [Elusimicrobia bacterium]|nr:glycosyltransferase [Elusimicrobiota bacterium]
MDKTKIFHLITSLNIGGTEKFLLTVLRNLKNKYDFSVGYLKERGHIADEIEKLGIPVIKFNFFSLVKYLKKNKPQIIHTHLYRANIIGRIAGKISRTPKILSSQRSIDGWKIFCHVWLDKITSHYCNLIIANSQAAKNILITREKIPSQKIIVIYNGVELPEHQNIRTSERIFTVAYIGRLHKEKGVYLIPKIAKIVCKKNDKIKFLIYGDGPEKGNLQLKVKNLKLENSVIFMGWQNNLENIYSSINILLLPSEEESFPQTALEAMSFGIPVIASDVGGVSEVVEHQKTGILIKSKSPESFADAILSISQDYYCYHHFSENSKIKATIFTVEKMINSMDNIYNNYIKK